MAMNQSDALDEIQQIMSAQRWTPETLEAIAEVMCKAGYAIDDVDDEDDLETLLDKADQRAKSQ